jgi:phosphoglycolate phosphatase-like HAD superfamily hydrolase
VQSLSFAAKLKFCTPEEGVSMTPKLLITDFDGVLCDSVQECFLVAYNAYQRVHSSSFRRVVNVADLDPAKLDQYRKLRPYLKGAEDMIPLLIAAEERVPIRNQSEFDRWREKHQAQLVTYEHAFYAERDYLQQQEQTLWLRLNPLFDGVAEALKPWQHFEAIYILTTKRRQDVLAIFRYQGIPFPAEQVIYSKAAEKSQKLRHILQTNGGAPSESVYVEDQVDFLVASQQHGIGSYLAAWGYVSEEQKMLAAHRHIPLIGIEEFQRLLRSFVLS